MALGRAAGAEERDDGIVRWVIGNSPIDYHNCVVFADLTREEADGEIEASLQRMRSHGVATYAVTRGPRLLARRTLDAPTRHRRAPHRTRFPIRRRRYRDVCGPLRVARKSTGAGKPRNRAGA